MGIVSLRYSLVWPAHQHSTGSTNCRSCTQSTPYLPAVCLCPPVPSFPAGCWLLLPLFFLLLPLLPPLSPLLSSAPLPPPFFSSSLFSSSFPLLLFSPHPSRSFSSRHTITILLRLFHFLFNSRHSFCSCKQPHSFILISFLTTVILLNLFLISDHPALFTYTSSSSILFFKLLCITTPVHSGPPFQYSIFSIQSSVSRSIPYPANRFGTFLARSSLLCSLHPQLICPRDIFHPNLNSTTLSDFTL